jgi:hypothetical protein
MHNGPPGRPGDTYYLWNDKIIYSKRVLWNDSNFIAYVVETERDTFDLQFLVTTSIEDNSILDISERYTILDAGNIVKELHYNQKVTLVEGQSGYGISNDKQTIMFDHIKIFFYDWSGYSARIRERELVKMCSLLMDRALSNH